MLLLGWAVGKSSTPVDDWFQRYRDSPARRLVVIADPWVLAIVLVAVLAVALYQRRYRLPAVTLLAPPGAIVLVQVIKPVFAARRKALWRIRAVM
jgi:hypothetical protein